MAGMMCGFLADFFGREDIMTFGDTQRGDRVELEAQAGPILQDWADILTGIMEQVARLERALSAIQRDMAELEVAGMYAAVPTESWESRSNTDHGEARYLRMLFPNGVLPGGRRKLYVGCDPAKIRKARKLAGNRRRWEALEAERQRLERFLRMVRSSVGGVAGQVSGYRIPDELRLELGTPAAPGGAPSVPKVAGEFVRPAGSGAEWRLGDESG